EPARAVLAGGAGSAPERPWLPGRLRRLLPEAPPPVEVAEQEVEGGLVRVPDDLLGEGEPGVVEQAVAGQEPGPELRERGGRRRCGGERLVQLLQLTANRLGVGRVDELEPYFLGRRQRGRLDLESVPHAGQQRGSGPRVFEACGREIRALEHKAGGSHDANRDG